MTRLARLAAKAALLCAVFASVTPAEAGIIAFTDRTAFLIALGGSAASDDYEAYALGDIANGSTLGDFSYTFGPTVQPAIAPSFVGQALGGAPFDVFVGGDAVTVASAPLLRAFGADFYYAPAFEAVPGNLYQLRVDDGSGAGSFVGNLDGLDPAGGSFFLGLSADPGFEFRTVTLLSFAPLDQNGDPYLTPAYQVDNLVYKRPSSVPEPNAWLLWVVGSVTFFSRQRVRRKIR